MVSLEAVCEQGVLFLGGGDSLNFRLSGDDLLFLATELHEGEGEESQEGDAGGLNGDDLVRNGINYLNDVAGHEHRQKDPVEDKVPDYGDGDGSTSNSSKIADRFSVFEDVNDIASESDEGNSNENRNSNSVEFTIFSVSSRILDGEHSLRALGWFETLFD